MKKACIVLCLLSAVLLPMALPNDVFNSGNAFLGLICLAPLYAALTLSPSLGFSALLGVVFAFFSTLLAHYWLLFYGEYSFWTISGVILGYMVYHAILAPVLSLVSRSDRKLRFLLLACVWTVYEYIKSTGFLAFPWGLLPHTAGAFPMVFQMVDITGVWGFTFVLAAANAWFSECLLVYWKGAIPLRVQLWRQGSFVLLLFLLAAAYGAYRWFTPIPYEKSMTVILVQHNQNPWETGRGEEAVRTAQKLSWDALGESSAENAGRGQGQIEPPMDLLVWSETALELFLDERWIDRALKAFPAGYPLLDFVEDIGRPLLVGAPFKPSGGNGYQNAALLLSPEGELLGFYGKQHLVPIAEVIPFYDFGPFKRFFGDFLGLSRGWEKGTVETLFRLPLREGGTVVFSTPICFEDAFPDLCRRFIRRGADLLINLTNVAWSRRESAETQMHVAAVFRSIENRRVLVRATNAGVTSVIGPKGETLGILDLFVQESLMLEFPVYREESLTAYTRFGDYFPFVLLAAVALCIGQAVVKKGKAKNRRKDSGS